MKYILFLVMLFGGTLFSCQKSPDTPQKLAVAGIADTVVVDVSGSINFTTNLPATFKLNKDVAGIIDSNGVFKAGATNGVYLLTIKNTTDANDSIFKTIVVTKYATIFNNMQSKGGYLLSFRHANASNGSDNVNSTMPEWWKSCDPSIARQLTVKIGPQQSDTTGKVLKLLKLPFDTIMTSVFCRTKQTAEFFNLSLPIKEYEALSQVYDEPNRYAKTMNLYASKQVNKFNYIAVTHAGFSNAPNPAPMASLEWGDCAVFKLNGVGIAPTYTATIKLIEWMQLGKR